MHSERLIAELEDRAKQCRRDIFTMLLGAGGGHVGPSLSLVELCVALFFHHAALDPARPEWALRDRIVLGKAHACETLYACMGRLGFFSPDLFPTYKHFGSILQGHADAWATRGIEYSGGSLGQGLSFALGLALAARHTTAYNRMRRGPDYPYRVFCLSGDGEIHEGNIWEAAMAASHYQLSNLVHIIDYNQFSASTSIVEGMNVEPLVDKWRAFGWWTAEIDGHNLAQILDTLDLVDKIPGAPKCIIAHTVKGKGVPYYEETHLHMPAVTQEDYDRALATLYM